MGAKIGLIAGGGALPLEFLRSMRELNEKVTVFALQGMAVEEIENEGYKVYWLDIGQLKKCVFLLLKERVRRLVMLGKVPKNVIYKKGTHDGTARKILNNVSDNKDYSLLEEITRKLKLIGIEVISPHTFLPHLLPAKGVLGRVLPDTRVEKDIDFGYNIAKKIAAMDIGQTIVVKDAAVVAVEAMEGTDETIKRAHSLAGSGCVMIKVGRPEQDMRWDVPTVGPETMGKLSDNKFSAVVIESGKMFLVDRDRLLESAERSGISVMVL